MSIAGTLASTVGEKNPIRYRGYYYDTETNLYYLNSRYYDPETGRFISADVVAEGGNLYTYCQNDPINRRDESGYSSWLVGAKRWIKNTAEKVKASIVAAVVSAKKIVNNTFGVATTAVGNYDIENDLVVARYESGEAMTQFIDGNFEKPVTFYAQSSSKWNKFTDSEIGINVNIGNGGFSLSLGAHMGFSLAIDIGGNSVKTSVGLIESGMAIGRNTQFKQKSAEVYNGVYVRQGILGALAVLIWGSGATQAAANS